MRLLLLLLISSTAIAGEGLFDKQGNYYFLVVGGAIDSKTGQFYPESGDSGYINNRDGTYYPAFTVPEEDVEYEEEYEYYDE